MRNFWTHWENSRNYNLLLFLKVVAWKSDFGQHLTIVYFYNSRFLTESLDNVGGELRIDSVSIANKELKLIHQTQNHSPQLFTVPGGFHVNRIRAVIEVLQSGAAKVS